LSFERSTSISLIVVEVGERPATTRTCSPIRNSSRAAFCATSALDLPT
jgi:hypothetical protein